MILNYLKIAIRNLSKHKLFSFINIFGLALSMSVCMLVLLRIKDQVAYDKFHPKSDKTYRIITELHNVQGNKYRLASTPLPLAENLKNEYSIIELSFRIHPAGDQKVATGKKQLSIRSAFADSSFFDVFGFSLKGGSPDNALNAPNSLVLTQESAERLFNDQNPVGQIVHLEKLGDFLVTGVMGKQKGKSHIDFDAYLSMSTVPILEKKGLISKTLDQWSNFTSGYTYVVLKERTSVKQLRLASNKLASDLARFSEKKGKENLVFDIQPLSKIILGEELLNSIGNTGSRGKVLAEIGISFIILLSACFNYTNLSIARSLSRGKEVGIRKVSGARRLQVFNQFVIESLIISFFALGLAYVLLKLIIDFAPFSGEMIPSGFHFDIQLLCWFILFTIFCSLLAGILPAWSLSSFNPVQVLKNLSTVKLFGGKRFRQGLIIAQFALCLIITIFTTIFSRQFNYMANADPGFNRKDVLSIPLNGVDPHIIAAEIGRISGVQRVGVSSENLGISASGSVPVKSQPDNQSIGMDYIDVDSDFLQVMDLKLLSGNLFLSDNKEGNDKYIIINESAARALQFPQSGDAIGKTVWLQDSVSVQISGVVKNFYFEGLEQPVSPLILRNRSAYFNFLVVRTSGNNVTIKEAVKQTWNKLQPGSVFEGQWLEDIIYRKRSASSTVSMLGFLSFMAITIACLGLLGMVIYTTETRRKEIGIRKVMGASVSAIITLLSKNFVRLIVIAGLIALPIGYIMGYFFLNLFANRINLGIGNLVLCFLLLLVLVLIVISSQIYKVAVSNPVQSLRTE